MRYELTNLGPGPFYCVERAMLVKPGESIRVNVVDEGTRRLADGSRPRLAIVNLEEVGAARLLDDESKLQADVEGAPVTATAQRAEASTPASVKAKDAAKAVRGAQPEAVPRSRGDAKNVAEPTVNADIIK